MKKENKYVTFETIGLKKENKWVTFETIGKSLKKENNENNYIRVMVKGSSSLDDWNYFRSSTRVTFSYHNKTMDK